MKDTVKEYDKPDIEIFVDTIITDNEERTIEYAIHTMGFNDLKLKKKLYYGIKTNENSDLKETADALLKSGEVVNMAKEVPLVKIADKYYTFDVANGLTEVEEKETNVDNNYLTFDKDDMVGEGIFQTIKHHFSINGVEKISRGKMWSLDSNVEISEDVVASQIFHNPHSMDIYKA